MRRDADRVAVGDFGNRNAAIDRRLKVDMVRADAGGQRALELRGLGAPLGGQIGRPKRLRDSYLGIGQFENGRPSGRESGGPNVEIPGDDVSLKKNTTKTILNKKN